MKRLFRLLAFALAIVVWLVSGAAPFQSAGSHVASAAEELTGNGNPFASQLLISNTALGAHSVASADFDRDGRLDLLAASREDGQIVWYRNTGGLRFSYRLLTVAPGTYSAIPVDVDRDGYLDVVAVAVGTLAPSAASAADEQPLLNEGVVFWLQNNLPASAQFTRHEIAGGLGYPVAVHAADIERDGDSDILVTARDANQVLLYENGGTGTVPNFNARVLDGNLSGAVSVTTGDVDGDGKLDVLATGENLNQIVWYRNAGARPAVFEPRFIRNGPVPNPILDYAKTVTTADLDKDGDLDIIYGSEQENQIGWYENRGGGSFAEHILITGVDHVKMVTTTDVDRDGDIDIFVAASDDNTVRLLENDGQPAPTFTARLITDTAMGARSVHVADFDRDGDFDLAVASRNDNTIMLHLNSGIHRSALVEAERIINTYSATRSVAAGDIDDDGRMDVVSTANNVVAWHRNTGGSPPTFTSTVIDSTFQGGRWVTTADLDSDGDVDVIGADRPTHSIVVYENQLRQSGTPIFERTVIAQDAMRVRDVNAADLDLDGDMDLYSASDGDNIIAWYENLDGSAHNFAKRIVPSTVIYPRSSFAADLNGDGWPDLMSASAQDNRVTIFLQRSRGVFEEQVIYSFADGAQFIHSGDIDGDTDMDIIVSSERDNTITWFANRLAAGRGFQRYVVSDRAYGVHAAIAGDMDADGDNDIIAAIEYSDQIMWYENSGGFNPTWTEHLISPLADVAHGVNVADLDSDGDLDVLSASRADGKVAWYENRGGQFGISQGTSGGSSGTQQVLLNVVFSNRGRAGDSPMALRSLLLRFENNLGQRLTPLQATNLFNALLVYNDNGDGQFNPSFDTMLARETAFVLNNGELTIDAAGTQTPPGAASRYFVVADQRNLTCDIGTIRVTMVSTSRTAADNITGRPLLGEYMRDLNDTGDPYQGRRPPIVINEIMADNVTALVDPDEPLEYPDWFELFNPSDQYIEMGGMYLTDDPSNLRQYRIPDGVTIAPNGYLVFIADGEPEQGALHVPFSLNKDGETLVLYDVNERGNQAIDQLTFQSAVTDQSIGRSPGDTNVWVQFSTATPGRYNLNMAMSDSVFLPMLSTRSVCY